MSDNPNAISDVWSRIVLSAIPNMQIAGLIATFDEVGTIANSVDINTPDGQAIIKEISPILSALTDELAQKVKA